MRPLLCLLLLVAMAVPATASGGLSCAAEDEAVTLSLDGGVARGMGGALFSFSGSAEIHAGQIEDDLRATEFARDHVAQYWLDGEVLKLRLYREREGNAPHGYVEVVVDTAYDIKEGEFRGDYLVSVYDMTDAQNSEAETAELSGAVSCFVE